MTKAGVKRVRVSDTGPDDACCGAIEVEPLGAADGSDLAAVFSALGDPIRLRLLGLLAGAPGGAVCVCDLVPAVGRSQPTVSHHLRILGEAGLVVAERRGKWVWYSVNGQQLDALRSALGRVPFTAAAR